MAVPSVVASASLSDLGTSRGATYWTLTPTINATTTAVYVALHSLGHDAGAATASFTYAGTAMTLIYNNFIDTGTGGQRIYRIRSGDAGWQTGSTTIAVVDDWAGAALFGAMTIIEVKDVNLVTTEGTPVVSNVGASGGTTATVSDATVNDLVLDWVNFDNNDVAPTVGASQTGIFNASAGVECDSATRSVVNCSYQSGSDGGAMSWTCSPNANAIRMVAVTLFGGAAAGLLLDGYDEGC